MSILLTVLAFNFIIIIHELGHFVVARLAGVRVLEFSLFVGPKLFSIHRGETEYAIRLFPILAYVKLEGEDQASDDQRSFSKKSVAARAAIIAAGPIANLLSSIIILTIVFSITGFNSTVVDSVGYGSPAYNAGIRSGDKVVGYADKAIYMPMNVLEFMYVNKGAATDVEYMHNGQLIKSVITPMVIPANRYALGFGTVDAYGSPNSNIVSMVSSSSPAQTAGLQVNDKIIKMNSTNVETLNDMLDFINNNGNKSITMTVIRNGAVVQLKPAVPMQNNNAEAYDIGITYKFVPANFIQALGNSVVFTYSTIRDVVYTVGWLIAGKVSIHQMTGPVGIVMTINDAASQGVNGMEKILSLLFMTAFISTAVGATNLIPFPALDGGRLLVLLVEAVRRKPLASNKEAVINSIGFLLLIIFAIFITSNDIIRIFK